MRFAILTLSDRAYEGKRVDESGPALADAVRANHWQVVETGISPDDEPQIREQLTQWADSARFDVILTTGGTGFALRDVTPEATRAIIQRPTPGLDEAMRLASLKVTPHAMLSRAISGIRGRTLIVNLPGSPKAALENFAVIAPVLPHAVQLLSDDPSSERGHSAPLATPAPLGYNPAAQKPTVKKIERGKQ